MLIFCDTEFTGLHQTNARLISMALVAGERNTFYAELPEGDGWARNECSAFVMDHVLPMLKGGRNQVARSDLKGKLLEWWARDTRPAQIACDSPIDFQYLKAILGEEWPAHVGGKSYYDLRPLVDTTIYDATVQRYYRADRPRHNALNDARAYRLGWLAWKRSGQQTVWR